MKKHFDAQHEQRYGTCAPEERAEIVSLRTAVSGVMRKPPQEKIAAGGPEPVKEAFTGKRPVYYDGVGFTDTPTYARAHLVAGNKITGPALVEEHASTTVLAPGDMLTVNAYGHLEIAVGLAREGTLCTQKCHKHHQPSAFRVMNRPIQCF